MAKQKLQLSCLPSLFVLVICFRNCTAQETNTTCESSSCGNITISSPFRLKNDPPNCGYHWHELSCENNQTVLYLFSGKYYVRDIDYSNLTIRLTDVGMNETNCSSIPQNYLNANNFSYFGASAFQTRAWDDEKLGKTLTFMSCSNRVDSRLYVETAPCFSFGSYSYVMIGGGLTDVENSCRVELMVLSSLVNVSYNISYMDIYRDMVYGFELLWYNVICYGCRGEVFCQLDDGARRDCSSIGFFEAFVEDMSSYRYLILLCIGAVITSKTIFGSPFVFAFLIYTWRKRHLSMDGAIEEFLSKQNELMPVRYSYSDIKRMTHNFKFKLGEGGYGSVYKGKLRSGHFAAIKMLGKTNANGQEFISEVATIGRIHHVNVVRLIGFCADRSNRALVYDFMPNGSLDKYVFSRQGATQLSWEKMYDIALGVARGIDYLHRGCEMQILHFDIKPHNILLDEDFTPKVSDFGLAKLYPASDNTVALTAVRGTIGYIAPELFYKNIGGVSFKADVYSFGMLLLEMAGKRNNKNANIEHSSQVYFPSWVYNEVAGGGPLIADTTEDGEKLAKKIVTVGLWCIQMKPSDRPSMNKVVGMLEAEVESLELPPKPVLFPEETTMIDTGVCSDETWSSSFHYDDSTEATSLLMS